MNHLVFDIDYKRGDVNVFEVLNKLYNYVDNHPIIKVLYSSATDYTYASY